MEIEHYSPGRFCWIELAARDRQVAERFYSGLFGWTTRDIPMGEQGVYVMFQKNGRDIGAMWETAEHPPAWTSYISIANVDDATETAKRLGATVLGGPLDVMDAGRMAYLADPQGAPFALWEPKKHAGADLLYEPSTLCWNELLTSDRDAAARFYSELVGWRCEETPNALMPYYVAFVGEDRAAGMFKMPDDMAAHMKPQWMPYIAVTDCDAMSAKARELGGSVIVEPRDIPKIGRFSMIRDPQGAFFCIIDLAASMH